MSIDRIKELAQKINQARNDYYNGQSKVSDMLYDTWINELEGLDPKNLAVIGIGAGPVSSWEKWVHKVPMGSLFKTQVDSEYKTWHNKYIAAGDQILLTLKLDGLSAALIYEDGVLINATLRGSGVAGEKITPNIAKMIGVPLRLKDKINITVRGEILLSKENHTKYFPEYSNPRNAASGICRRFDGKGCEHLSILTYDLTSDFDLKTQEELYLKLKELGFMIPDYYILNTYDEVIKLKNEYQSTLRDKYAYLLDGLVAHNNSLFKQIQAGSLNGKPFASIAIKFESVAKEACVVDILIQTGHSGRLTPVAVFDPKVDLCGAQVEKASLHNFGNINNLGVDIGCKVLVCRSNDVVPFIEEVSESTGTVFETPTNCPVCGTAVIQTGEYVQCPNTYGCPAQLAGSIHNWIGELNILEWGTSVVEKLVESGKVKNVADLYKLTIDDLTSLDRMGKKSAKKCYDNLWEANEIPLEVFLGGLSIPLIGQSTIKLIMAAGCDSLEKIGQLEAKHFEMVSGIGPARAASLANGLKEKQQLILDILAAGIKIKDKVVGKLSGLSFVYTGTMVNKRAVLEKMAQDAGGTIKSSVSKELTYLVCNETDSTSNKMTNAKKLGIKVITEDQFLEMLK